MQRRSRLEIEPGDVSVRVPIKTKTKTTGVGTPPRALGTPSENHQNRGRIDAQPGASASSFTRIMVNGHAQSSTVDSNARPTSTDSAAGALATAAFAGKMVKKVSAAKKRWLLKNALSKQMMGFAKNFWRYDTDRSGEIDRCVLITC